MEKQFILYLSSTGCSGFYKNSYSNFTNILSAPIAHASQYEVALIELKVSPAPSTADIVHVCLDILQPISYNNTKLPVVGLYPRSAFPIYRRIASDTIDSINCKLINQQGEILGNQTDSTTVLALHFREWNIQ